MNTPSSICSVCGCALASDASICPLCGEPVETDALDQARDAGAVSGSLPREARRGAHAAPSSGRSKKRLVIGFATAGFLVLVALGVWAFQTWSGDEELRLRAEQVEQQQEPRSGLAGVASAASSSSSDARTGQSAVSGGGIMARDGDDVWWALDGAVGYQDASSTDSSALQVVAGVSAACLNVEDGTLYFVDVSQATPANQFRGSTICRLEDARNRSNASQSPQVLYRAAGAASVGSLVGHEGNVYFMSYDADGCSCMTMPCDGSQGARELGRFQADEAWVFANGAMLYVVSAGESSWDVQSLDLRAHDAVFESWMSGSGRLKSACVSGEALYFSLQGNEGCSRLYRKDVTGGFSEYEGTEGALRVAVDGDVAAVVTQAGGLLWLNTQTRIVHDVSSPLDESDLQVVPATLGVGIGDDRIYCVDRYGRGMAYDLRTKDAWSVDAAKGMN